MKRSKYGNKRTAKRSKYGNKRTTLDGIKFHSKKEAERYAELKLAQMGRVIRGLERQKKMPLIVNEILVGTYIADFYYIEQSRPADHPARVIEDVKPLDKKTGKFITTKDFDIKWKLAQALYPEIGAWRLA